MPGSPTSAPEHERERKGRQLALLTPVGLGPAGQPNALVRVLPATRMGPRSLGVMHVEHHPVEPDVEVDGDLLADRVGVAGHHIAAVAPGHIFASCATTWSFEGAVAPTGLIPASSERAPVLSGDPDDELDELIVNGRPTRATRGSPAPPFAPRELSVPAKERLWRDEEGSPAPSRQQPRGRRGSPDPQGGRRRAH
jgi:hypothetical protein